jgi:hypothetical protein
MAFSLLNKEKIASLLRLLKAQEREEKVKNHQEAAQWRRTVEPGA